MSWAKVFRSVAADVSWGLTHRWFDGIGAIGVDELAWKKRHKYLTIMYPCTSSTMAASGCCGSARPHQADFQAFFDFLGEARA